MNNFSSHIKNVFSYIKNPNCNNKQDSNYTKEYKIKLLLSILLLSFAINFIFILLISLIEELGLIDMDNHSVIELFKNNSVPTVILLAVIIAPLFEELIFRGPLTWFCKYKKGFKYIYYAFAVAFGYIHITNYEVTTNILLLSPILVGPQIVLGLFQGYIRIHLGLIYSILFHAVYNAILVIPGVLVYTP